MKRDAGLFLATLLAACNSPGGQSFGVPPDRAAQGDTDVMTMTYLIGHDAE